MNDPSTQKSTSHPKIQAPRGPALSCRAWPQEAALRMLMNSLDPQVSENPDEFIVHAGARAARNWRSYDAIVAALRGLGSHETLLVQAGELAGGRSSRPEAPCVLIADTNIANTNVTLPSGGATQSVPFEDTGPLASGQIGAAIWMYTGTQGALHTAYMVFAAAAQKHFGGTLAGKLVVSGGMGGGGGAQALAAAWNGAAFLGIDADAEHIKRREKGGYCDVLVNNLDEAMRILKNAVRKREPASVGLAANCAEIVPALAERGIVPDLLTDQTFAQDPLAYIPRELGIAAADELRRRDPREYRRRALDSIAAHARGMLELRRLGSVLFDFGNGLWTRAQQAGVQEAVDIPRTHAEYLRPMLRNGIAPLLWVALSGQPSDIRHLDDLLLEQFSADNSLTHWMQLMRRRARFEGLPARVCWLERHERARFATMINDLVAAGELQAPIALGCDLDQASIPPPGNHAEAKRDDPATIAGWLNWPAVRAAAGASLLAVQNADGSTASMMIVADGQRETKSRIERLFSPP